MPTDATRPTNIPPPGQTSSLSSDTSSVGGGHSGTEDAGDPCDPFGAIDPELVGDCEAMVARLYHFLDGELTEARRLKIQAHLDSCPSCFSAFDFEAELRIVVQKRLVVRVPQSLAERIRKSLSDSDGC